VETGGLSQVACYRRKMKTGPFEPLGSLNFFVF
jgi:hypothetical protein